MKLGVPEIGHAQPLEEEEELEVNNVKTTPFKILEKEHKLCRVLFCD